MSSARRTNRARCGLLALAMLVVTPATLTLAPACDSGFNKAPAKPKKPKKKTPPSPADDAGRDAGGEPGDAIFIPPPASSDVPKDTTLLELGESDTLEFCQAHQARFDALARHYAKGEPLCRILSSAEAAASAQTERRFATQCELAVEECLEAGAPASLDALLPDPVLDLGCEDWEPSDACDPDAQAVVDCLEQAVSVLAEALGTLNSCTTGLERAQDGRETLAQLAELENALFVTEACEPVQCLTQPVESE